MTSTKNCFLLSLILLLAPISNSWSRDKSSFNSRRCGEIKIQAVTEEGDVEVCRIDSGVLDVGHQTKDSITELMAPVKLINNTKKASVIVDEVLLLKIKQKAEEKLKPLDQILALPNNEETEELKADVKEFRSTLLDSKLAPIHQIRTILSVYPTIQDEILAEQPDYEPLFCKYEVWKNNRLVLNKVAKISAKILSLSILVGSLPAAGAAFYGAFSIQSLGSIMMALGGAEMGVSGFHLFTVAQNWDDVRAGRMAKRILKINSELQDYIKELQKDPLGNEVKILAAQELLLSQTTQNQLQNLKKDKNGRIKEVISGSLRIILGGLTFSAGRTVQKRFSDFKTSDPATVTNPYSGGQNGGGGGGGFPGDDGG